MFDRRPIHICVGDPNMGHLDEIMAAASSGKSEFDWWNITKRAEPGDRVIFYMKGPVSAFVAAGILGRKADDVPHAQRSEYYRVDSSYWINEVAMLPQALTLADAKVKFPHWRYLNRPVVTSIPNLETSNEQVEDFLHLLQTPSSPIEPVDAAKPPPRIPSTVLRILRDTALAQEIKRKHRHKCQICGHRIKLSDGSFYAEAHHIRPLGGKHQGLDVASNILCLCPNHHAELDFGVRKLAIEELRCVDGHSIEQANLAYHNRLIFTPN